MKRYMIALTLCLSLVTSSLVFAGASGGPRVGVSRIVPAYSTIEYRVVFRGGENGRVVLQGDHDTDLDLYVFDELGRLVDVDDDHTDTCIASWYASYTQQFTIRVVNRGGVYNEFDLATN